ncbi:MAG: type II toxin-antitoxin system prevent-host-death family antitoxin [Pseudomonadota bacterium]|jgi:prevent-host-death family protein
MLEHCVGVLGVGVALVADSWAAAGSADAMKSKSAREAKNGFGLMIDNIRTEPVLIKKHGLGVVVVISVA